MSTSPSFHAAILDLNACWNAAFNAGNAEKVASLYDAGAALAPAGSAQITGRDHIRNFWQSLMDQGVGEHRIECVEIGAADTLAYQRGLWSASASGSDGGKQHFGGNLLVVYRLQPDGSWRALAHSWN